MVGASFGSGIVIGGNRNGKLAERGPCKNIIDSLILARGLHMGTLFLILPKSMFCLKYDSACGYAFSHSLDPGQFRVIDNMKVVGAAHSPYHRCTIPSLEQA